MSINSHHILETYLAALPQMSRATQTHFYERMYRITGNDHYLALVKDLVFSNLAEELNKYSQLLTINPTTIQSKEQVRATMRRHPLESIRINRREAFYLTHPILKFCFDSLYNLDRLLSLGKLHSADDVQFEQVIAVFKKYDWRQFFFKPGHLKINPVSFVNSVYFLRNLGIVDLVSQMKLMVSEIYPVAVLQENELLYDQIYAYTHIIINESNFYQQFLDETARNEVQVLLDFFEQYFDSIIINVNLDLVIEMLLCFRLAQRPNSNLEVKGQAYIKSFIDPDTGCLKADEAATLEDMEHANILLIMLLEFPSQFYRV